MLLPSMYSTVYSINGAYIAMSIQYKRNMEAKLVAPPIANKCNYLFYSHLGACNR